MEPASSLRRLLKSGRTVSKALELPAERHNAARRRAEEIFPGSVQAGAPRAMVSGRRVLLDLPEKLPPSGLLAASLRFGEGKAQKWVSHCEIVLNLVRAASKVRPQKKARGAM